MGKNSAIENVLNGGSLSEGEIRQMAFCDADGSSFLQSLADRGGAKILEKKRGRPRGKQNRDTALLARMIERRVGCDPELWVADILGTDPFQIAKAFNAKPFDVLQFQAGLALKLGERIHGKARQAIELSDKDGNAVPIWNMNFFETQKAAMLANDFGIPQGVEFIDKNQSEVLEVTHTIVTDDKEQ